MDAYYSAKFKKQKELSSKFQNSFRNPILEAISGQLGVKLNVLGQNSSLNDDKPMININDNKQNGNIVVQLTEELYPYLKDYGKIDNALSKLSDEMLNALSLNFNTEVEPKLANLKNKSITSSEFETYLKKIAKEIMNNEAQYDVAKNNMQLTGKIERNRKTLERLVNLLTEANDEKIAVQGVYKPQSSDKKDALINICKELLKIDKNVLNIHYASILSNQAENTIPIINQQEGYVYSKLDSYLRKLSKNEVLIFATNYYDEVVNYTSILNNPNELDDFDQILASYKARKTEFLPITGSGLGGLKSSNEHKIMNKYYVDKYKLNKNILEIRYIKNRHLIPVKSSFISSLFKTMIEDVLNNVKPSFEKYKKLSRIEQNLFKNLIPYLGLDFEDFEDDEDNSFSKRFEIIRGEILAGNTNLAIRKEARQYLIHLYQTGKLSRSNYLTICDDLDL